MIEDTLDGAKSKRYRHAARHLAECQSLASLISDYGGFEIAHRLRCPASRQAQPQGGFLDAGGDAPPVGV